MESNRKKIVIAALSATLLTICVFARQKQNVSKAALERGRVVYEATCIACHQAGGGGVPYLNPPLKGKYISGDKSTLIKVVLKGMNEQIEIDGIIYNNPMPAFAQLSDQQIADVLTYIRNSFGNNAIPISAAQVKAERARLKREV